MKTINSGRPGPLAVLVWFGRTHITSFIAHQQLSIMQSNTNNVEGSADRPSPVRGTPFPLDADSVLFRRESVINTAHLPDSASARPSHGGGVRGYPIGGRFGFQLEALVKKKPSQLREWIITSHRVASLKGNRVMGYKNCTFYGALARLNFRMRASSVVHHIYKDNVVV